MRNERITRPDGTKRIYVRRDPRPVDVPPAGVQLVSEFLDGEDWVGSRAHLNDGQTHRRRARQRQLRP